MQRNNGKLLFNELHGDKPIAFEEQKALRKGQGNSNDIFKKEGRITYILKKTYETF